MSDKSNEKERDDVLRRMLKTPPQPHKGERESVDSSQERPSDEADGDRSGGLPHK